jgi:hypothetical protein
MIYFNKKERAGQRILQRKSVVCSPLALRSSTSNVPFGISGSSDLEGRTLQVLGSIH